VHVALGDQRIERRHERPVRRLELRMRPARVGHLLHGGAARCVRELVLPGHAQHRVRLPGRDGHRGVMDHRGAGCAGDVERGEVSRPQSQLLGDHADRHGPLRHTDRRGEQAVHVGERQARVCEGGLSRRALQLQRPHAGHAAERAFADAGDGRVHFSSSLAISIRWISEDPSPTR
jgi:hypothetical protein